MKNSFLFFAVLIVFVLGLFYFFSKATTSRPQPNETTTTKADKSIGKTQSIGGFSITPLEVIEDSRCPVDVECIWAGTVKVRVNIDSAEKVLELGIPLELGSSIVTLVSVTPAPISGQKLAQGEYNFVFTSTPK